MTLIVAVEYKSLEYARVLQCDRKQRWVPIDQNFPSSKVILVGRDLGTIGRDEAEDLIRGSLEALHFFVLWMLVGLEGTSDPTAVGETKKKFLFYMCSLGFLGHLGRLAGPE